MSENTVSSTSTESADVLTWAQGAERLGVPEAWLRAKVRERSYVDDTGATRVSFTDEDLLEIKALRS